MLITFDEVKKLLDPKRYGYKYISLEDKLKLQTLEKQTKKNNKYKPLKKHNRTKNK